MTSRALLAAWDAVVWELARRARADAGRPLCARTEAPFTAIFWGASPRCSPRGIVLDSRTQPQPATQRLLVAATAGAKVTRNCLIFPA